MSTKQAPGSRRGTLLDILVLGSCFGLLSVFAWRRTPDLFIDFGMQLYIPWQISEGKDLYVDLAWKHGPLSQYLNGFLFRLFGTSLTTLMTFNLLIAAMIAGFSYRFFRLTADRIAAVGATLAFLCLFAFSQYIRLGNWNYLTPYTHEATHGTWLALAATLCLLEYTRTGKPRWVITAGAAFGAVCLTKLEFIIPTGATILTWFLIQFSFGFSKPRPLATLAGRLLAAAAGILTIAIGILTWRTSFSVATGNIWRSWTLALQSNAAQTGLYRSFLGIDNLGGNISTMLRVFAVIIGIVGICIGSEFLVKADTTRRPAIAVLAGGLAAGTAFLLNPNWGLVARPFPLVCLTVIGLGIFECLRGPDEVTARLRAVGMTLWGVLALLFQLKIFFRPEITVYGFIHAMPAALLSVALLTCWIPTLLKERGLHGDLFRAVFLGLIAVTTLKYLDTSKSFLIPKNFVVGPNGDTILTLPPTLDSRGYELTLAQADLRSRMGPNDTLTVFPEGILLNYWLRRPTPVPYLAYVPYDLTTFGGEAVTLNRLKKNPPTFITIIHRPTPEWGTPFFGTSPVYGKSIMDWINNDYRQINRIGAQPFTSEKFGIAIYERIPDPKP